MNKAFYLYLMIFFHVSVFARIGDTQFVSKNRYGEPKENYSADKSYPVISELKKDTITKTYDYKGWRIRVAFYKDKAIRMNYTKHFKQGTSQKLTSQEINSILKAEGDGKKWSKASNSINPAKLVTNIILKNNSWVSSDGKVATLQGFGSSLIIDAPEVQKYIKQLKEKKKEVDRNNIPEF